MSKRFMGIFLSLLLFAQAQDASSFCVAVWYPSSEHPEGAKSITDNLKVIDVVHPFWYTPQPDGSLRLHADAEDPELLAAWRGAGLVVMPSIFSSTWSFLEPPFRERHIEAIVALVESLAYDGIDLDYEGFAASTREPFANFVAALAKELHARGRLLSVTVHPKTSDVGSWEAAAAQDWLQLADAADVLNIMTYDYTSRNEPPGPLAPTDWVLEVLAYAATVTDLHKVRVGLPFYAYSWKRGQPPASAVTWEAAQRLGSAFGLEVTRDPRSNEAILELAVKGLPKQTLYLADAEALEPKLNRLLESYPELGGVAIWGLGGEDPAAWTSLRERRPGSCPSR